MYNKYASNTDKHPIKLKNPKVAKGLEDPKG